MSNELAVIGASGHGKVVADIAEKLGFVISFFDGICIVKPPSICGTSLFFNLILAKVPLIMT